MTLRQSRSKTSIVFAFAGSVGLCNAPQPRRVARPKNLPDTRSLQRVQCDLLHVTLSGAVSTRRRLTPGDASADRGRNFACLLYERAEHEALCAIGLSLGHGRRS